MLLACGNRTTTNKVETAEKPKTAYLAAYMKGNDDKNMYYALATEGFRFKIMNGGKPILSASYNDKLLRDPMIIKDKEGIYHLVATVSWKNQPFTIWDSKDLVTWENERLVNIAPEGATKTWAPEFAYDEENDIYFVHWTAELNDDWDTASIYYATTHDFINFSAPKILYSLDGTGILDANIIKVNGEYHLIYRNNGVWLATSKNAQGPYGNPYELCPENVEGPYAFPLNEGNGYGIVWDYFSKSLGFGLWTSPEFKNWTRITNEKYPYYNDLVEFPEDIRHGSIIPLDQEELDMVLKGYDSDY
jgi:predicted GH43/DUF377 family glycosyl hydrolase